MPFARVAVDMTVAQKIKLLTATPRAEWEPESPWLRTFHYKIPSRLDGQVAVGHLVWVPFGRKQIQGIVVALDDTSPVADIRDVTRVVDPLPVVTPSQIELGIWMSQEYFCPLFDSLSIMLPIGMLRQSRSVVDVAENPPPGARLADLSLKQQQTLEALRQAGPLALAGAQRRFGNSTIQGLLKRGWLVQRDDLPWPHVRPRVVQYARLAMPADEARERARSLGRDTAQSRVLVRLLEQASGAMPLPELLAASEAPMAAAKALADQGLLRLTPERHLLALTQQSVKALKLSPQRQTALGYLHEQGGPVELSRMLAEGGASRAVINGLVELGLVERRDEAAEAMLAVSPEDARRALAGLTGAERLLALLDEVIRHGGLVSLTDLRQGSNYTKKAMDSLAGAGIITMEEHRVLRDPLEGQDFVLTEPPRFTPAQEDAWAQIQMSLGQGRHDVFLIHGVTGSGKTEIYLRAAQEVVSQGKQVIALVPEISLTPQTITRFAARFPERLAVIHSQLSAGERYDEWTRIRAGEVDVVVGPRSALFSPFSSLGLIILDEEHAATYKQEEIPGQQVPSYHAREAAIRLGQICKAPVLLGSATPSLASFYRAEVGLYKLISMPQRVMGHRQVWRDQQRRYGIADSRYQAHEVGGYQEAQYMELPPVQVVDLRQELRAGNRSIFSRVLQDAVRQTLAAKEQAILFLNRRGASTFVMCRDCGHVITCPRCHLPMTFHASGAQLVCHRCNLRQVELSECPQCHSERIRYFGIGTQRVEEAARELWPKARIMRWDSDIVSQGKSHEELMGKLTRREVDLVVGTQMIAKGLDFPLVTLVGVITADTALNLPDFRASEWTFQLLEQVAGRAGRSILGGRVIVQTYAPEHYAVRAASYHDYHGFYREEMAFRREQGYPPVRRLAKLVHTSRRNGEAEAEAERVAALLREKLAQLELEAVEVVGPAPCFVSPVQGRYRWQILILGNELPVLLAQIPYLPGWSLDIDPVSVL